MACEACYVLIEALELANKNTQGYQTLYEDEIKNSIQLQNRLEELISKVKGHLETCQQGRADYEPLLPTM